MDSDHEKSESMRTRWNTRT